MSESDQTPQPSGLVGCFQDFEGAYCLRKLVEFVLSSLYLVAGIVILTFFLIKYKEARPFWLSAILSLLLLSLIANICFCFYNTYYWLYALESFFYNTYYLVLVCYVCYAYVLKHTGEGRTESTGSNQSDLEGSVCMPYQKVLFYSAMGLLIAVDLSIFIASLIYEIQHEQQEFSSNPGNVHYCQEIWYMILNVICVALSLIVVAVMLKSQQEESAKMKEFYQLERDTARQQATPEGDEPKRTVSSRSSASLSESLLDKNVKNPFKNLWVWVGLNVGGQLINLIQSGLELQALPPQCLLVSANPNESNILSLVFVLLTLYIPYGATLWYICWVKTISAKTVVDRTVLYSEEWRESGNIELFVPSRQETITIQ